MKPRIAIPLPHGGDLEYALRAIPQYERAVELSGGEPVRIPLDRPPAEIMKTVEQCDGVLLPGSKADVDPAKFDAPRHPKTAAADPRRDTVDELLLQDAYNMRKPILGVCYGLQILNVYQSGNLLQHIESPVNHEAGSKVPIAHDVAIDPESKLARIVSAENVEGQASTPVHSPQSRSDDISIARHVSAGNRGEQDRVPKGTAHDGQESGGRGFSRAERRLNKDGALAPDSILIPANSSHHQAAGDVIGDGLKIVARCPDDNVIEALEGTSPGHFVLAVQWHPERSFDTDSRSRAIFSALVEAAREKHRQLANEFESAR